jgi:hypothetical protein
MLARSHRTSTKYNRLSPDWTTRSGPTTRCRLVGRRRSYEWWVGASREYPPTAPSPAGVATPRLHGGHTGEFVYGLGVGTTGAARGGTDTLRRFSRAVCQNALADCYYRS